MAGRQDGWTMRVIHGAGWWVVGLGVLAWVTWITGLALLLAFGQVPHQPGLGMVGFHLFLAGLVACPCVAVLAGVRLAVAGEGGWTCVFGGVYVGLLALPHLVLSVLNTILSPFASFS